MAELTQTRPWRMTPWLWGLAASAIPFAVLVVLIAKNAVNVPFWDAWELPVGFQIADVGTVNLDWLAAQHNEHRILVSRTIMYELAKLTHWNVNAELAVSVAFAAAAFACVAGLIRRSFDDRNGILVAVLTFVAALLMFSPAQWENWLWGWQMAWFACVFGAVAAIRMIVAIPPATEAAEAGEGERKRGQVRWIAPIAAAILAAGISTYSLGGGMWIWPAGLLVLLARWRGILPIVAWLAGGAVLLGLYFHGYDPTPLPGPSTTIYPWDDLSGFTNYVFMYLGSILGAESQAKTFGVLLVVIFCASVVYAVIRDRSRIAVLAPWAAIALFVVGGASTTAASRLAAGVEQALQSRYTTVSLLFVLATIVVSTIAVRLLLAERVELLRLAGVLGLAGIAGLALAGYGRGADSMKVHHDQLVIARACLDSAQAAADPCLTTLYPDAATVWGRIDYMRQKGWLQ